MALRVDDVLRGYASGWFPMGEPNGSIAWYKPHRRAVFPLDGLKVARSLRQTIRKGALRTTINTAFEDVMRGCASREETWISAEIIRTYVRLHDMGFAHSVETYADGTLVGGLYGVTLGGAFFGESMFSTMTDASKVALVALVDRLRERQFVLLDAQFMTPHLRSMGAVAISAAEYEQQLAHALTVARQFYP